MNRRVGLVLSLITVTLIVCAAPAASAHTLKIDGDIGVTLHSDPNDDLRTGQLTKFAVVIQDRTDRFDPKRPSNCACVLEVRRDGQSVTSMPFVTGNTYVPLTYTFTEAGAYDIVISGKPDNGNSFQSFRTTFTSYVKGDGVAAGDTQAVPANSLEKFVPAVVLTTGVIVMLIAIDPLNIRRRRLL